MKNLFLLGLLAIAVSCSEADVASDNLPIMGLWSYFLHAKTSSYEREIKLVEALRFYASIFSYVDTYGGKLARQTLKELGYE